MRERFLLFVAIRIIRSHLCIGVEFINLHTYQLFVNLSSTLALEPNA